MRVTRNGGCGIVFLEPAASLGPIGMARFFVPGYRCMNQDADEFPDPESLIAYLTRQARTTAGDVNYDRATVRQQLLDLLRQGITYREIADHLHATEKTIRRLVRRSTLEAQPCPPS